MSAGAKGGESSLEVKGLREGLFHTTVVELVVLDRGMIGWPFGSLAARIASNMHVAHSQEQGIRTSNGFPDSTAKGQVRSREDNECY